MVQTTPAVSVATRCARMPVPRLPETHPHLDLDRYVPAFLTWIANKLSRGASQHYLCSLL